ncbi:MAG: HDOD domain-containing protein [Deltaproteobacteria bacterium]|nr:HDOD domain-containing protein [Deltaproteobacteria bacterium]
MEEQTKIPEEYQGRVSSEKSWMEIVAWVGDLPPLPQVAAKAIQLVENPDTSAQQITTVLSSDTALAARVLKIANSAMFSRQREITTLSQAVMVIGFKALKGIIVAATLRQLNRKNGKLEQLVWQNSMCTAMGAHVVAQRLRKPYVDELFLLGLLHDLGKLVLIRQAAEDFNKVIALAKEGKAFVEVEQELLGFSHPLIGALVAKKWNFPPEACQVILHHHDQLEAPLDTTLDQKTAIVQFANCMSHVLGHGNLEGFMDYSGLLASTGNLLGLNPADITELSEKTNTTFMEQSSAFQ